MAEPVVIGIVIGMGGGMLASGRIIDRYTRRSRRAFALAPAISLAIAAPFYLGFVWVAAWPAALALLTVVMFFNYFYLSCSVTLTQEEVPANQRVLAGALLLLVMNLVGLGLGPTYLGFASDLFRASHPDNSLQLAFSASCQKASKWH